MISLRCCSTCDSRIRTGVPLFFALFRHAVVGRLQVNIIVHVRRLQIANVRWIANELHGIVAAFALDPLCGCPLADAPAGLVGGATEFVPVRRTVVPPCVAPRSLMGELPEGSALQSNPCTDPVGWIMITPPVTPGVPWAGLDGIHCKAAEPSQHQYHQCRPHVTSSMSRIRLSGTETSCFLRWLSLVCTTLEDDYLCFKIMVIRGRPRTSVAMLTLKGR